MPGINGGAYLAAGHLDHAIGVNQETSEIDSNGSILLSSLANADFPHGNSDAARTLAGRCLAIDPNDRACTRIFEEIG